MKKSIWSLIIMLCFSTGLFGQDFTGEQIIKKVNDLMNQETIFSKSTMTIITTSGAERSFVYESWSKDFGEKNLMRYLSPARVKGQATLMLNHADDIWVYFPRTQRVRKLATHAKKQKMEGSDFSYEDMGSGDSFIVDYIPKKLKDEKMEGESCYKIELIRKEDSDLSYSRLIMWITKEGFVPIVIDYYDDLDPDMLLKRLVQSDITDIDGIPTPRVIVMYNKVDNTQTSMTISEIEYNKEMDDYMFTERGLKK
ncbi:MAG: outer membrane lipoprotein-sorting protein [Bacteroidales bacterium]|nr:outer membrane lipoprotein-sorting protein [Bacteroidales bacterium]